MEIVAKSPTDNAYLGLTEDGPIPRSYLEKYYPLLEHNILRGGMRLAYLIITLFSQET